MPKGALRLPVFRPHHAQWNVVRKHRAPQGTLRQNERQVYEHTVEHGPKAPSTKRCIKTWTPTLVRISSMVRSESTEHPKISHAIPLVQTSMNGENRDISTVQLQVLKEWKPNCIRHFPTTLQDQRQKVHYDAPHSMIHRLTRTHVRKHRAPKDALKLATCRRRSSQPSPS